MTAGRLSHASYCFIESRKSVLICLAYDVVTVSAVCFNGTKFCQLVGRHVNHTIKQCCGPG